MTSRPDIQVRRVYDPPDKQDGTRVLIDRIWPRGISKADAHIDEWPKEITPSTDLRHWFHGEQGSYAEFRRRYLAELKAPERADELERLRAEARTHTVTLVTSVREPEHSHAAVLAERLRAR
ncbi:DUF488 domain-containing protein [Streptomyces xiamenensis]